MSVVISTIYCRCVPYDVFITVVDIDILNTNYNIVNFTLKKKKPLN